MSFGVLSAVNGISVFCSGYFSDKFQRRIILGLVYATRGIAFLALLLLSGKVALVTGASRGIGKSIALSLGALGAEVIVNYSASEASAEEVAKSINNQGGSSYKLKFDVSDEESVNEGINQIIKDSGKIDILINNAGITRDGLLMRMKTSQWDEVLNTNLKGVFLCTKNVSKFMIKQRSGKIINITSIVGLIGNPGQANYAASKAGVIGFTKTCAKEFSSRGIKVNAIAPGFIETEMTENLKTDDLLKMIPLGKLGSADQIASLVNFLVSSDASEYITGQTISIDGGMNM